ncbi:MerR family transcriptional regulator [Xenococcus sp. PCC 7305]|uniref:MerR family transcriptional regulator n=1 Tax=Xenococcus sp. PCC 7305 TaxID=102125 RepID=UPI000593BE66
MGEAFFTSTEASKITGCSRRQLQYWRRQGVVVPTVNPGGKGRNVYYSESDLLILAVMEYLLSIGLNFDTSLTALNILMTKNLFLSAKSWTKDQTRLMFFLSLDNEEVRLENFNVELAKQKLEEGYPVIPFCCDRIYDKLQSNLKYFHQGQSDISCRENN